MMLQKKGTLSFAEVEYLRGRLQGVNQPEILQHKSTPGLYDIVSKLCTLNENAIKGYGRLDDSAAMYNYGIYTLKESLLYNLAHELIRRGEDVGFADSVVYIRNKSTGIQYSFHVRRNIIDRTTPFDSLPYTNKQPEWDGVRGGWKLTPQEYKERLQAVKESRERLLILYNSFIYDVCNTTKKTLSHWSRRKKYLSQTMTTEELNNRTSEAMEKCQKKEYTDEMSVDRFRIEMYLHHAFGAMLNYQQTQALTTLISNGLTLRWNVYAEAFSEIKSEL